MKPAAPMSVSEDGGRGPGEKRAVFVGRSWRVVLGPIAAVNETARDIGTIAPESGGRGRRRSSGRSDRALGTIRPGTGATSAMVKMGERRRKLRDFLKGSFHPDDFDTWLKESDYAEVAEAVTEKAAAGKYFSDVIEALDHRGWIDGSFFGLLAAERAAKRRPIEGLAGLWGVRDRACSARSGVPGRPTPLPVPAPAYCFAQARHPGR